MPKRLFIHEKTVDILLKILDAEENGKRVYPMLIAKEVNSPYSYVSKILNEFEKFAIVESEFEGRTKVLKLTKNGRKVAELFKEIVKLLECDLVSRDRIEKLKEIYERSPKNFRSLAGIIAEIERLKKSKDEEVLRIVNDLENEIKKVISNDGGGS
jgi:predicted transcriptional regulator